MKKKYAIGVDIGGSHISAVLVDMESSRLMNESLSTQKVDNQASAQEIFRNWSVAIGKTMSFVSVKELAGIGFAMPGPFDYSTGVARLKNVAKYDNLYGTNIGDELKKLLNLPATMPFRYLNDALAFAVGECWLGKSSAFTNVVAITLGTGFGSAFVSHGVPIVDGPTVPPMGYVYNIPYENGIADDYFSTRWFVNEYTNRTGTQVSGVKEIADRYEKDPEAQYLFETFGNNLGNFMAPLFKNFDADCLVIGGNIAGAFSLFGASFKKALNKNHQHIEVILSELKESAAMVGCARLLDDNFWRNIEPVVFKLDDSTK